MADPSQDHTVKGFEVNQAEVDACLRLHTEFPRCVASHAFLANNVLIDGVALRSTAGAPGDLDDDFKRVHASYFAKFVRDVLSTMLVLGVCPWTLLKTSDGHLVPSVPPIESYKILTEWSVRQHRVLYHVVKRDIVSAYTSSASSARGESSFPESSVEPARLTRAETQRLDNGVYAPETDNVDPIYAVLEGPFNPPSACGVLRSQVKTLLPSYEHLRQRLEIENLSSERAMDKMVLVEMPDIGTAKAVPQVANYGSTSERSSAQSNVINDAHDRIQAQKEYNGEGASQVNQVPGGWATQTLLPGGHAVVTPRAEVASNSIDYLALFKEECALAYGVPPSMLVEGRAARQGSEESHREMFDITIQTLVNYFRDVCTPIWRTINGDVQLLRSQWDIFQRFLYREMRDRLRATQEADERRATRHLLDSTTPEHLRLRFDMHPEMREWAQLLQDDDGDDVDDSSESGPVHKKVANGLYEAKSGITRPGLGARNLGPNGGDHVPRFTRGVNASAASSDTLPGARERAVFRRGIDLSASMRIPKSAMLKIVGGHVRSMRARNGRRVRPLEREFAVLERKLGSVQRVVAERRRKRIIDRRRQELAQQGHVMLGDNVDEWFNEEDENYDDYDYDEEDADDVIDPAQVDVHDVYVSEVHAFSEFENFHIGEVFSEYVRKRPQDREWAEQNMKQMQQYSRIRTESMEIVLRFDKRSQQRTPEEIFQSFIMFGESPEEYIDQMRAAAGQPRVQRYSSADLRKLREFRDKAYTAMMQDSFSKSLLNVILRDRQRQVAQAKTDSAEHARNQIKRDQSKGASSSSSSSKPKSATETSSSSSSTSTSSNDKKEQKKEQSKKATGQPLSKDSDKTASASKSDKGSSSSSSKKGDSETGKKRKERPDDDSSSSSSKDSGEPKKKKQKTKK